MSNGLSVLFLGNHTVGVRTLRAIQRHARLVGIVAHPEDPEDGVRYESVFAEAGRLGIPTLRASGKSTELEAFIKRCAPALLWIADYRYLLSPTVLQLAPLGAINLHPSLLPAYRGRAPVNWAILHGETRLGLTAHFVEEGMDSGDIVGQRAFELGRSQDVGDALQMLYPLYESLTAEVLTNLPSRRVERRVQDARKATAFPRRRPEDGRIDWSAPAEQVWNLIRAVAAPYPGAFSPRREGTVRIWKASGVEPFASIGRPTPGEVLRISADGKTLRVACGDAGLVVTRFELADTTVVLRAGEQLGVAGIETSVPALVS